MTFLKDHVVPGTRLEQVIRDFLDNSPGTNKGNTKKGAGKAATRDRILEGNAFMRSFIAKHGPSPKVKGTKKGGSKFWFRLLDTPSVPPPHGKPTKCCQ